jgi:hypothetical protein
MTFLGKLLVFLNAILATALLSWSVSLYTNRVDWPSAEYRGKFSQDVGFKDAKLTALPPALGKDIATKNNQYADALATVRNAEAQLFDRTRALATKIQQAKDGQFFELDRPGIRPGQNPSDRLDLTSTRKTTVAKKDRTGNDIVVELRGLDLLQKELQKAVDDTVAGTAALEATGNSIRGIDRDVAAFNDGILRYRLARERRHDEKRYLDDNRVNWDAQLITLQKRNDQLIERLKVFGVTLPVVAVPVPAVVGSR